MHCETVVGGENRAKEGPRLISTNHIHRLTFVSSSQTCRLSFAVFSNRVCMCALHSLMTRNDDTVRVVSIYVTLTMSLVVLLHYCSILLYCFILYLQ